MFDKILSFLSKFYYALSKLERRFFEIFPFLTYKPKAYVISVGNISMGGTGKTPVLFELLKETKAKSCVLTRGYRCPWENSFYLLQGKDEHPFELTDEALMANKRFPEIPILVGKNRHHSAIVADNTFKPKIMFLDDGFQYRRIKKDFNILLWDSMIKPQDAFTVPKGKLREPFERLSSANCILLTRCETSSPEHVEYWENKIKQVAPNAPIIRMKTVCDGIYNITGELVSPSKNGYLAFSGIGNPTSFYAQLEKMGCKIILKKEFRDHHRFSSNDLNEVYIAAKEKHLSIICTEKDYIKIPVEYAKKLRIEVLTIRAVPVNGGSLSQSLRLEKILN